VHDHAHPTRGPLGLSAVQLRTAKTPLTERAAELLAAGPADSRSLVLHACQMTQVTEMVAEHLAAVIVGNHQRFSRGADGLWRLAPDGAATSGVVSLGAASFVVVDVETTGSRGRAGDRITEIAAVQVRGGEARLVYESLVNPERPIPSAITALTGITSTMVRNAPRFRDICDDVLRVLGGQIFVAHNARFDWGFISAEVERATGGVHQLHGGQLCTVRLSRRLVPELRRRNLGAVAEFFGIEIANRHRAAGDAVATAAVLLRLLGRARDSGLETVDDLQAAMRRPLRRRGKKRRSALPGPAVDDHAA
jgi:DNA polymerase III epsilon subunit family exonuclease